MKVADPVILVSMVVRVGVMVRRMSTDIRNLRRRRWRFKCFACK